jgi:hypothetical protein
MTTSMKPWPPLPYADWVDTMKTLHRWTQVVGKIRLERTSWINHSWHVALYVTPRGLTTSTMAHGTRAFQLDFDFLDDRLRIVTDGDESAAIALESKTVSAFYGEVMARLGDLGLPVTIHTTPNEIPDAEPFEEDTTHDAYDAEAVRRFHRVLLDADRVFRAFRARFCGKASPSHFFWGSFDLAVTRFSGREAPRHPAGVPNMPDWVAREAYSHEVSSAGFWPGGDAHPHPVFYAYAYPTPEGFDQAPVQPDDAVWLDGLGEFVLPYDALRETSDPDGALLAFLESTYEATAELAGWDRAKLELGDPVRRFA